MYEFCLKAGNKAPTTLSLAARTDYWTDVKLWHQAGQCGERIEGDELDILN
jgi:hypothetical protein